MSSRVLNLLQLAAPRCKQPRVSFDMKFPRGRFFTVLAADATPSPPRLQSAAFSNDGTKVVAEFDSPTNRGGFTNSFLCKSLLRSDSVITDSTACVWLDDKSFFLYPNSGSRWLEVGDSLSLKPNSTVKAKCQGVSGVAVCESWQASPSVSISVTAPSNPSLPVVNLASPSLIGPCDSLAIDLSGSRGSGGRMFLVHQLVFLSSFLS